MLRTLVAAVVALACACFAQTPALANILVAINKSSQHMTVSVDGQPRYYWPVSTGKQGHRTPAGTFRPFRMAAVYFSRKWDNAPMPHAIFFTAAGHAIHGSDAVSHLGSPASHGCVRLTRANAAMLFALVQAEGLGHTRVTISGTEPFRASSRSAARRALPRRFGGYDDGGPYGTPFDAFEAPGGYYDQGSGWF
jgi:hypothetical protein